VSSSGVAGFSPEVKSIFHGPEEPDDVAAAAGSALETIIFPEPSAPTLLLPPAT